MVTSLQDVSNSAKENYPSLGAAQQPANRSRKNTLVKTGAHVNDKKKGAESKTKDQVPPSPIEPAEMDQAFDQLLVSARLVN
jgi:hypothetical protein